jgi:membrane protein
MAAQVKGLWSTKTAPPPAPAARKISWLNGQLQRFAAAPARRKPTPTEATPKQTVKASRSAAPSKARAPSKSRPRASHGRIEALGWFLTAAVILAWPRERPLIDLEKLSVRLRRRGGAEPMTVEAEVLAAEALEPGHGRAARDPFHIPLRGWQDILWRTLREFGADNIPQVAGGVAFFGLLSIFPAMGAFVSLYGLFSNVQMAERQLDLLSGVLPDAALQMVGEQMLRLASARHSGLGLAFVVSLLVSLWSANAGVKALFAGLNIAFEETEKRNFLKLNLVSLSFTLGALTFMTIAFAAMVAAPVALAYLGYTPRGFAAMSVLRWPLLLLVAIGGITLLYRYGPSRHRESWPWVSWGSVFAAVLWLGVSLLFSVYVAHFGSYDRTYGSLGAAVGFMSWLWISSIAILFGAELNSELEHQTARDTTTGAPATMGRRGAHMADTLGDIRTAKRTGAPIRSSVRPASPRAHSASKGSPPRP